MVSLTSYTFSEAFLAKRAILATSTQSWNRLSSITKRRFSTGAPSSQTPSTNSPEWKGMLRNLEDYSKNPPIPSRVFMTSQATFKASSSTPQELEVSETKFDSLRKILDKELESFKKDLNKRIDLEFENIRKVIDNLEKEVVVK